MTGSNLGNPGRIGNDVWTQFFSIYAFIFITAKTSATTIDLKIVTQNATYLRFWLLRRNSVFNTSGRNVLVAGEEDEEEEEEEEEEVVEEEENGESGERESRRRQRQR